MTFEEKKTQLEQLVKSGELSVDEAEAQLFSFLVNQPDQGDFERSQQVSPVETILNTNPIVDNIPSMSNEELEGLTQNQNLPPEILQELQTETLLRQELRNKPLTEAVKDPFYWERIGRAALKGPAQAVNGITRGMPALALTGIAQATNDPIVQDAAQSAMKGFTDQNEVINDQFGSSDPIRVEESLAEATSSAFVPGGILTKATAVGTEFAVDQSIRELTDDVGEDFETIFDEVGLTDNNSSPVVGPIAAIGLGILGTTVTASGIKALKSAKIGPPKLRDIKDIDPNAPDNLKTLEKASDLTMTNIVDEQKALKNLAERAGVPNLDDVVDGIEFDTHASARTRVKEAIRTGDFESGGRTFKTPVAPQTLYSSYQNLDAVSKKDVADYIKLLNARDDAYIALNSGAPGNHQATIAMRDRELRAIAQRTPIATNFSRDYNLVTGAVREFIQDGLFSRPFKKQLDKTRANYVPLEMTPVDIEAPFLQRLSQATNQTDPGTKTDWFLEKRDSAGLFDINKQADPFDLLMEYSQAALTSQLKNDTKLRYVDALKNSEFGSDTIRLIEDGEKVDSSRVVNVYRNGEQERYVTSKLQANLLRFDPYIAKYPSLFAVKRIAENAMVGPLSITFAPVTAIRDTIGGAVLRPSGVSTGTPIDVIAAIPKITWAKARNKIAESINAKLQTGEAAIPESVMSKQTQAYLANRMANSYSASMYHLANEAGGFDASLMKNTVELNSGKLQEVKRTLQQGSGDNVVINNKAIRVSRQVLSNGIDGFLAMFAAIQDAPRFAALEKTFKKTGDLKKSSVGARNITGDVTKSGRVFDPQGKRIEVDAVDQGVLNIANEPIGQATELLRETTPFLNPMIQGTRNLVNSFANDPVGTNLRAWQFVGLPSVAAFGWNEMLGSEYNDYAMERRSARDVVMTNYIGIPGLPPEQGIEIPIVHELLFYNAPFNRFLYDYTRGAEGNEVAANMSIMSQEILQNSLDVGFPTAGALALNALGQNAPDSLLRTDGLYDIREDDIGFAPQNLEVMARTMFASVGDTAIELAYSLGAEDDNYETWRNTIVDNVVSRTPIAKNLSGKKKANVHFSIPAEYNKQKWDAYQEFDKYYTEHYEPKRFSEAGLEKPASNKKFTNANGRVAEEDDLAFRMIGPEPLKEPTNPVFKLFGAFVKDHIGRNEIGMSGLKDRERVYSKLLRQLRNYNAGDKTELAEWQAMLKVKNPKTLEGDDLKLQQFIQEHNVDLDTYDGRVKMINIIENERSNIIRKQMDVFSAVEAKMTQMLRKEGLLGPNENFDVTKHLKPFGHDALSSAPN